MDGDLNGAQAQGQDRQASPEGPQGHEDAQADGAQAMMGGDDEYQRALAAKDAEIEALRAKVADAAKTAEATEALSAQIEELKKQMSDERTEFALRSAGAHNVKAARALLDDYEGDVAALAEGEPWMFSRAGGTSQKDSQQSGGATGLEPAGAAGGSAERDMRRWERIAGLTEEEA